MVAITAVASYALLEIDMGQVGDQLRENGSTDIHPPLFRQRRNGPRSDFRPFSVQIVFSSKAGYPADYKSLTGLCKVLYRTPVMSHNPAGYIKHEMLRVTFHIEPGSDRRGGVDFHA
jgi:hypothetical protein